MYYPEIIEDIGIAFRLEELSRNRKTPQIARDRTKVTLYSKGFFFPAHDTFEKEYEEEIKQPIQTYSKGLIARIRGK